MHRRIVPNFLEMGADSQEKPDGVGLRNQRSHDRSRGRELISEIGGTGQSAHSAHSRMPGFAYRIVSLMHDNPILPIFRNLERLLTAAGLCIGDGDAIGIESPRGRGECKVFVANRIDPRVVCLYHGFAECNCNVLTDNEAIDPITGYTGLKSSLCKVEKI